MTINNADDGHDNDDTILIYIFIFARVYKGGFVVKVKLS